MARALATLGVGAYAALLALTRPGFVAYARRHGYDYYEPQVSSDRPAPWHKVLALRELLQRYDEVLWLDADVLVVGEPPDLGADVPAAAWQALAIHRSHRGWQGMGEVANTGVWLVRRAMQEPLACLWDMEQYIHHAWWENGAMVEMLGYETSGPTLFPVCLREMTELHHHTHILDAGWNWIEVENFDAQPLFVHMAGLPFAMRQEYIRRWLDKEQTGGRQSREQGASIYLDPSLSVAHPSPGGEQPRRHAEYTPGASERVWL